MESDEIAIIKAFTVEGQLIYQRTPTNQEEWYDTDGFLRHFRDSEIEYEYWCKPDVMNRTMRFKDCYGQEKEISVPRYGSIINIVPNKH